MDTDTIYIKVSGKSAYLKFRECGPTCIANGCTAKCCDAPTTPLGIKVSILDDDNIHMILDDNNVTVIDGYMQPRSGERLCPFKSDEHLCLLHDTIYKPFGCIVSPFFLNRNSTLVVRNRYKLLPCYDKTGGERAYRVFSSSLKAIFTEDVYKHVVDRLDLSNTSFMAPIRRVIYDRLREREGILKSG